MASQYHEQPLPTSPGQQTNYPPQQQQVHYQKQAPLQQPQSPVAKPPRSRGLSLQSDKSGGSNKKEPLVETHNEKERQRLHSKADPTMAMNEAEPSAIAAQSKNLLASLRALQHKDINGNVITDPDVSNPTRWREERPLATILAFEAAIDGNYRNSMVQTSGDADSVMSGWNRRSSYYASGNTGRLHHESYYGSRPQSSFRPENSQGQNPWGPPPDRRRIPRVGSEPQQRVRTNGANVYAAGTNQRSYETVASGSGTSGEQAGYQTDPTSSENSSIDRRQSPAKRDPANDFGIGFSQAAEYQPSAFSVAGQGGPQSGQDNGGGAPPAVPPKAGSLLRKATTQESRPKPGEGEKRKSWFKRIGKK